MVKASKFFSLARCKYVPILAIKIKMFTVLITEASIIFVYLFKKGLLL